MATASVGEPQRKAFDIAVELARQQQRCLQADSITSFCSVGTRIVFIAASSR
jgi:hypothetical protein